MNNVKQTLHEKLHNIRLKHNITQEQLAKELNIAISSLSNYEKGLRIPDAIFITNFSKFFDVSSDYLLGLEKELDNNPTDSPSFHETSVHSYIRGAFGVSSFPDKQETFFYNFAACIITMATSFPENEKTLLNLLSEICKLSCDISDTYGYNKDNFEHTVEHINSLLAFDMEKEFIINYIEYSVLIDKQYAAKLSNELNKYLNISSKKISKTLLNELKRACVEKHGDRLKDIFSEINIE